MVYYGKHICLLGKTMTIDDLRKFFRVDSDFEISQKLKLSKGTISKWRSRGIPVEQQAIIQIQTNGKLKADIQPLQELTA